MKKNLYIYAPSAKLGLRDLIKSNLINDFESNYNTEWIFNSNAPNLGLNKYRTIKINKIRYLIWYYLFQLRNHEHSIYVKKLKEYPFLGVGNFSKKLIKTITLLKLKYLTIFFLNLVLRITSPRLIKFKNDSYLLLFGSSQDLLLDDLVYASNNQKIKSFLIFLNWDSAITKPLLSKPTFLVTWGKQTRRLASKIHKVKSISIGSVRHEIYRNPKRNLEANDFLKNKILENKNYFLFAGCGVPFAEKELLKILDNMIIKHNLNIQIIYKKHPHAWPRNNEENIDLTKLKNVEIYDFPNDDFFIFPHLFQAIKGLITPYSTMMIDACFNNIPTFAVGYNSHQHRESDWRQYTNNIHLKSFKRNPLIVHCIEKDQIENLFLQFIELSNLKTIPKTYERYIKQIVYFDQINYFSRIQKMIN